MFLRKADNLPTGKNQGKVAVETREDGPQVTLVVVEQHTNHRGSLSNLATPFCSA